MANRHRICLVDDEQSVRDALSLGLDDSGFDVLAVGDAQSALDLIASRDDIAAVVTDMNMPGYDGGKLIAALRAARPSLPIVAISGGGEIGGRDVADVAADNGADACLSKPFRAADIAKALRALLPSA